MSIRIGTFVFTPSVLFLPFALAFFFVISSQRLYPGVSKSRVHASLTLAVAAVGGALGAWAYGWAASINEAGPLHSWLTFRFGSFGGYWGALGACMAYAALTRQPILRHGDALVPGILAGGAVARIGCLFTGCCRGIWIGSNPPNGLQPFRPWPAYDIAALLLTLALIHIVARRRGPDHNPGGPLCFFLIIYGVMRFSLEFFRDLDAVFWGLTVGQTTALAQILVGVALLASVSATRAGSPLPPEAE